MKKKLANEIGRAYHRLHHPQEEGGMSIEQLTSLINYLREEHKFYGRYDLIAVKLSPKALIHIINLLADERLHMTVHREKGL